MKPTFTQILTIELTRMLEPLMELDTAQEVADFLKELGFEREATQVENVAGLVPKGQELVEKVKALFEDAKELFEAVSETLGQEEEASIADYAAIGQEIKPIVSGVQDIKKLIEDIIPKLQEVAAVLSTVDEEEIGRRLGDYLIYTYLIEYRPQWYGVLHVVGIAETEETTDNGNKFDVKRIQWRRFGLLFTYPIDNFEEVYQWRSGFDGDEFLKRFEILLKAFSIPGGIYKQASHIREKLDNPTDAQEIRMPLFQKGKHPDDYAETGLNLSPVPTGLFLYPYAVGSFDHSFNLGEQYQVDLETGDVDLNLGVGLDISPDTELEIVKDPFGSGTGFNPFSTFNAKVNLFRKEDFRDHPIYLIGSPAGSHLSLENFELRFFANKDAASNKVDMGLEAQLEALELIIKIKGGDEEEADNFLKKNMPIDKFGLTFDLEAGYSLKRGFYLGENNDVEVYIPTHINLGPLDIVAMIISLGPSDDALKLGLGSDLTFSLGPFAAVVENIGLNTKLLFPGNGNAGGLDFKLGFKPPTGAGFSLDTGVVKGGGYLSIDREKERYVGALELTIDAAKFFISLKVIGIITTRLPNNPDGFSMLLLITAEFTPIQLTFGFTLNGVGGLVCINRGMNTDVLRDGVRNNTLDNILFPEDPIANITEIVKSLDEAFPVEEGLYTFGIMLIIGWGTPTLVSLEVGLIIQVPAPIKLAILGVLKAELPDRDNPKIVLQVNFAGIIDMGAKFISFDASIYDSRILNISLAGDMIFRLKWGKGSNFLFSIGGFHPSYNPPPLKVPSMKRLTINLLGEDNPRLTLEAYFAITSNTVQFGSKLSFFYDVPAFDNVVIIGHLGFDVLIQFSPFYFDVFLSIYFSVIRKEEAIMEILLEGGMQGPNPYHFKGKGEIDIVFTVSVDIDKTWGTEDTTVLEAIPVLGKLRKAVEATSSWMTELPPNSSLLVTTRQIEATTDELIAHPNGQIALRQSVLPLNKNINLFGNQRPSDFNRFELDLELGNPADMANFEKKSLKEQFAPAQFVAMSDSEKLSRPSFEDLDAGMTIRDTGKLQFDRYYQRQVEFEKLVIDKREKVSWRDRLSIRNANQFVSHTAATTVATSPLGSSSLGGGLSSDPQVTLQSETYVIAQVDDMQPHDALVLGSETEAWERLEELIAADPTLENQLQVVSSFELV